MDLDDLTPMEGGDASSTLGEQKGISQLFNNEDLSNKLTSLLTNNEKNVVPVDSTGKALNISDIASNLANWELQNQRLANVITKLEDMDSKGQQTLSDTQKESLVNLLEQVKSTRNTADQTILDTVIKDIQQDKTVDVSSITNRLNVVQNDRIILDPDKVKSLADKIDNKIQQLESEGKQCPQGKKLNSVLKEVVALQQINQQVKESETKGMTVDEERDVVKELEALTSPGDDKKDNKDDQRQQRNQEDSKTEEEPEIDEVSETDLGDGLDGVGEGLSEGTSDLASEGLSDSAMGVVDSAGGAAVDETALSAVAPEAAGGAAAEAGAGAAAEAGAGVAAEAGAGVAAEAGAGAASAVLPEAVTGVVGTLGSVEIALLPEEAAVVAVT